MRHGVRRGGRGAGHRRHQGRRSRQGRSGLHHHVGHRPGPRGPFAVDPHRPARRPHPRLGDDRRSRHRHHVGARRIEFETVLESDCAPLDGADPRPCWKPARRSAACATRPAAASRAPSTNWRPPRGWASSSTRRRSRSRPEVRGACEMLGLDPLYVANEGKLIAVVPPEDADRRAGGDAGPSAGTERRDHRRSRGRAPRHGHHAVAGRRRAGRHHAGGRTIAEDLLMSIVRGFDSCSTGEPIADFGAAQ